MNATDLANMISGGYVSRIAIYGKDNDKPLAVFESFRGTCNEISESEHSCGECHWFGSIGCGFADGTYDAEEDVYHSFPVISHNFSCGHSALTKELEPPNYCPQCGRKVVER